MQNYNIYEEVASNDPGITIFKGRRKQSIKFVDIKRVDKSIRGQILNEVGVLYILNHPNIQKFISWYETPKHLWVIVEHCAGGNLSEMIQDAGRLPETTAVRFLHQLVQALFYIHSQALVNPSFDPKHLLIDENGILRLSRFPWADSLNVRNQLSDQAKQSLRSLNDSERLSRASMRALPVPAPEWFIKNGDTVPSFSTDLWSLGCLAYNLLTGVVPFCTSVSASLSTGEDEQKVKPLLPIFSPESILAPFAEVATSLSSIEQLTSTLSRPSMWKCASIHEPPGWPRTPEAYGATPVMAHFIRRLLAKNPQERMDWYELLSHPIWKHHGVDFDATLNPSVLQKSQEAVTLRPSVSVQVKPTEADVSSAVASAANTAAIAEAIPDSSLVSENLDNSNNADLELLGKSALRASRVTRQRVHYTIDQADKAADDMEEKKHLQENVSLQQQKSLPTSTNQVDLQLNESKTSHAQRKNLEQSTTSIDSETEYRALVRDSAIDRLFLKREVVPIALVDMDAWTSLYMAFQFPKAPHDHDILTTHTSHVTPWDLALAGASEEDLSNLVIQNIKKLDTLCQRLSTPNLSTEVDSRAKLILREVILTVASFMRPSPSWDSGFNFAMLVFPERKDGTFFPLPPSELNAQNRISSIFSIRGGIPMIMALLEKLEKLIMQCCGVYDGVNLATQSDQSDAQLLSSEKGGVSTSGENATLSATLTMLSPRTRSEVQFSDTSLSDLTVSSLVCLAMCSTLHLAARAIRSARNVDSKQLMNLCSIASMAITRGVSSAEYLLVCSSGDTPNRLLCGQLLYAGVLALGEITFFSAYETVSSLRKGNESANLAEDVMARLLPHHAFVALMKSLSMFRQFFVRNSAIDENSPPPYQKWPLLAVDLASSAALALRLLENVCHFLTNSSKCFQNEIVNLVSLILMRDHALVDHITSMVVILGHSLYENPFSNVKEKSGAQEVVRPRNRGIIIAPNVVVSTMASHALDALSSICILGLPILSADLRNQAMHLMASKAFVGFANLTGNLERTEPAEFKIEPSQIVQWVEKWRTAQLKFLKTIEMSRLLKSSLEGVLKRIVIAKVNLHAVRRAMLLLSWILLVTEDPKSSESAISMVLHDSPPVSVITNPMQGVSKEGHFIACKLSLTDLDMLIGKLRVNDSLESNLSLFFAFAMSLCHMNASSLSYLSSNDVTPAIDGKLKIDEKYIVDLFKMGAPPVTTLRLSSCSLLLTTLLIDRNPSLWLPIMSKIRVKQVQSQVQGQSRIVCRTMKEPLEPLFIVDKETTRMVSSERDSPTAIQIAFGVQSVLTDMLSVVPRGSNPHTSFIAEIGQIALFMKNSWNPLWIGNAASAILRSLGQNISRISTGIYRHLEVAKVEMGSSEVIEMTVLRIPTRKSNVEITFEEGFVLTLNAAASVEILKVLGGASNLLITQEKTEVLRQVVSSVDGARRVTDISIYPNQNSPLDLASEIMSRQVFSALTEAYAEAFAEFASRITPEAKVLLSKE